MEWKGNKKGGPCYTKYFVKHHNSGALNRVGQELAEKGFVKFLFLVIATVHNCFLSVSNNMIGCQSQIHEGQ